MSSRPVRVPGHGRRRGAGRARPGVFAARRGEEQYQSQITRPCGHGPPRRPRPPLPMPTPSRRSRQGSAPWRRRAVARRGVECRREPAESPTRPDASRCVGRPGQWSRAPCSAGHPCRLRSSKRPRTGRWPASSAPLDASRRWRHEGVALAPRPRPVAHSGSERPGPQRSTVRATPARRACWPRLVWVLPGPATPRQRRRTRQLFEGEQRWRSRSGTPRRASLSSRCSRG